MKLLAMTKAGVGRWYSWLWLSLPLLAIGVFFDVLFSTDRVVGSAGTDMAQQFIA